MKRTFTVRQVEGGVPLKCWTKGVPVEDKAIEQLERVARMPFIVAPIAVMPDVHVGIGSTVGSVIATSGAIIPAAVGVDIGCVDCETEFLSKNGWKRISDWQGEEVLQYLPETGRAEFVVPMKWVKLPCSEFMHIHTKYGVDQKLDLDHTVLYAPYDRSYSFSKRKTMTAGDIKRWHDRTKLGFRGRFITTFNPKIDTKLEWSDAELRVIMMVAADGCFVSGTGTRTHLKLKKRRKISRALNLLRDASIAVDVKDPVEGVVSLKFYAPTRLKSLNLWKASTSQLKIIVEEALHWDGNKNDSCFYTRDRMSADFMSYAFAATGMRSVLRSDRHKRDGILDYRVYGHKNVLVGINGSPKTPISLEPGVDGFKYCFTLPSGFWIMRRGGVIAATGNCGMLAQRIKIHSPHLLEDKEGLRAAIEQMVPHGRSDDGGPNDRGAWKDPPSLILSFWNMLKDEYNNVLVRKYPWLDRGATVTQLGTLGTGNHFIEICLDEEDMGWIVIHSGSRGPGNRIGTDFTRLAREQARKWYIDLPDPDLSYFPEGTEFYDDYLQAVRWAQKYALLNREAMMVRVLETLIMRGLSPGLPVDFDHDADESRCIDCRHNYVDMEHHHGRNMLVTRKGAVRARKGDWGIIPGSMGARSFIVKGLGSPDSLQSCSHGAGRAMSRTDALKRFTVADHVAATQGIECAKDESVLDETPGSYKDIEAVMHAQRDLVEIVHTLRQVVCVKGGKDR